MIAGWSEARRDGSGMVTPDDRDRIELRLHHAALPKLAESSFVSYDREAGDVALADPPDLLDAVLDRSLERERIANGAASPDDEPRVGDE